ncbi:anti-sigma factor [Streptomyces sp. NBC_01216]|uniref:anti-sigma factor n=1 Tax=Streptomyces sp. NBC_01216 TaxID=2903778 RepID=UPI002E152C2A|nr:anti-sigma factor [Streptomyces sp. NBC_01216]
MNPTGDPHLDAGAYALHALPPAEEAAFERHLAGCEACRREVEQFRETAALLGAADLVQPPRDLRARVLDGITRVPQPGRTGPAPAPAARRGPAARGRRALNLALAASLAAAVSLGGLAAWQFSRAEDARDDAARVRAQAVAARSEAAAFDAVLTAPDASLHTRTLTGGSTAAVVVSRSEGRAAFTAQRLPPLSGGHVYELWYAAASGDLRPAGLLPGTGRSAPRVLDGPLGDAVAVGVTVEPSGGSAQPTSTPLGIIPFDS